MQKQSAPHTQHTDGTATPLPFMGNMDAGPDGALISGDPADKGKITVVYNRGDTPPKITIRETSGHIQMVMANDKAVAVVAQANGTRLTADDVLLIERFVATRD